MQSLLKRVQTLHFHGHYQQALEKLYELADLMELKIHNFKLFSSNIHVDHIPFLITFYLELGHITLKLSLLQLSEKAVTTNHALFKIIPINEHIITNGLILAKIQYWLCKYKEASDILTCLLRWESLNVNNEVEIYQQLANTHRAWCRYELAEENISKALELSESGAQVSEVVKSNAIFVKARLCMDTDQSLVGLELAQRCLEMRVGFYGGINPEHSDISLAQELLAKLYFSRGDVSNAEKYHNQAYESKMKSLGEFNFETVDSINERGRIMLSKKKIRSFAQYYPYEAQAIHYFSRLGVISQILLGPCNQYQALSHNNLGCALYNQGDYENSIAHHVQALKLYESLCGNNHYKLVFSLNQMAYAHKQGKRYTAALSLWKRCVDILEHNTAGPLSDKSLKTIKEQIRQVSNQIED